MVIVDTTLIDTVVIKAAKFRAVAGKTARGLYLMPPKVKILQQMVHSCTFFGVYTPAPYFREIYQINHADMLKASAVGAGLGNHRFLSDVLEILPSSYPGPFVVGLSWKKTNSTDK